jgi:hypothetical protein
MKVGSFQGTIFLQSSFPRRRESRFVLAQLAWIPAFAGMTEPQRWPRSLLSCRTVLSKEHTKVTKVSHSALRAPIIVLNFVLFVTFVVRRFGLT